VTDRKELLSLDEKAERVAGLFGNTGVMPYVTDPGSAKYPSLAEMTAAAIRILSKDPDGFFLMVEGGNIDHAAHKNLLMEDLTETLAFADAVAAATAWAQDKRNGILAGEVLIVVTADHETGGLKVVRNNGRGKLPEVTWAGKNHTSEPVPLYAWGKRAERLGKVRDNTEIRAAITGEQPLRIAGEGAQQEDTDAKSEQETGEYSTTQGRK
jgi:alkaline phosphatase